MVPRTRSDQDLVRRFHVDCDAIRSVWRRSEVAVLSSLGRHSLCRVEQHLCFPVPHRANTQLLGQERVHPHQIHMEAQGQGLHVQLLLLARPVSSSVHDSGHSLVVVVAGSRSLAGSRERRHQGRQGRKNRSQDKSRRTDGSARTARQAVQNHIAATEGTQND